MKARALMRRAFGVLPVMQPTSKLPPYLSPFVGGLAVGIDGFFSVVQFEDVGTKLGKLVGRAPGTGVGEEDAVAVVMCGAVVPMKVKVARHGASVADVSADMVVGKLGERTVSEVADDRQMAAAAKIGRARGAGVLVDGGVLPREPRLDDEGS